MNPQEQTGPGGTRELLLMRAGGRAFAVGADETDGEAHPCPPPTPLPHAPHAVLGVVCLRGRMRTVLDPLALVSPQGEDDTDQAERDGARGVENNSVGGAEQRDEGVKQSDEASRRLVVALRGDEQLALAVESVEGVIRVPAAALAAPQRPAPPLRAALEHEGASLLVLDPAQLFDAAMQGTERRRRRT